MTCWWCSTDPSGMFSLLVCAKFTVCAYRVTCGELCWCSACGELSCIQRPFVPCSLRYGLVHLPSRTSRLWSCGHYLLLHTVPYFPLLTHYLSFLTSGEIYSLTCFLKTQWKVKNWWHFSTSCFRQRLSSSVFACSAARNSSMCRGTKDSI